MSKRGDKETYVLSPAKRSSRTLRLKEKYQPGTLPKRHCWLEVHTEESGRCTDWCIHCGALRHADERERPIWSYRLVTMATTTPTEPACPSHVSETQNEKNEVQK